MRGERRNAGHVVRGPVDRILVGAEIDPDDAGSARARREPLRDSLDAIAVEAETVDDALVRVEPEQPRTRIARLRLRRDAARLDKAEAQPQQRIDHFGMLVEAGRQADRIGKRQAERLDAQLFVVRRRTGQRRMLERIEGEPMRRLRIELAQQRPRQMVEQRNHASSGNTCFPSAPSGSGLTQRTAESGRVP